ncbi:hypothetical protein EAF00_008792 [Botryotinia globosa]|nr:hypothetical protein EAF00_008792 [Botryotinia globosa]
MSSGDYAEFAPVRLALIYHLSCHRFLRRDDLASPRINEEESNATQLREISPITDIGENNSAASISNVRTLLKLPAGSTATAASIAELEELLYSPTITRTSRRIGWAILVESVSAFCFRSSLWVSGGIDEIPLCTLELLKILFLFPAILLLFISGLPDIYHNTSEIHQTFMNDKKMEAVSWKKMIMNPVQGLFRLYFGMFGASFSHSQPVATFLYVIAFAPLGIFIPPVWGFVLVGRMITEWGNCVKLY